MKNSNISENFELLLAQIGNQELVNQLRAAIKQKMGNTKLPFLRNNALLTDSYKPSHYRQYPKDATSLFSYIESRGGEYADLVFFGLQMILKEYLSTPLTYSDVQEAKEIWTEHGVPFDEEGFNYIVEKYNGFFPVRIYALDEGTVIPTSMPMVRVEAYDARAVAAGSWLESLLLQVWYPITVATLSWSCKAILKKYLEDTSDDVQAAGLNFKLHDFGFRGASSVETAARGGCAHLVNFQGSDTMPGVLAARHYYGAQMPAFSIPAAEHSTITAWGREGEQDAYRNMIKEFSKPGQAYAVVSDSYDLDNAVSNIWGNELKAEVIASGGLLVVRPDSGDPETIVLRTLHNLDKAYGSTSNSKGYKVLNHVRIIQGDGVNRRSIRNILAAIKLAGFSTENVAFGMGGGLLQDVNRDTGKFAMKASAILRNGKWVDVFKDPITDKGKTSKKGRVTTYVNAQGEFKAGLVDNPPAGYVDALTLVWDTGVLLKDHDFEEIRDRANSALPKAKPVELALEC